MHRIDTKTAQKDKFGAGKNGFTRGNPQTGTPATDLDDDYFDMLQEELCSVVEASGASLEKGRHDQLLTALSALLLSRKNPFGDIKSDGTVKTALENLGLPELLNLKRDKTDNRFSTFVFESGRPEDSLWLAYDEQKKQFAIAFKVDGAAKYVYLQNKGGSLALEEQVTAQAILTKLLQVDGSGSGLDADLVRGLPADFGSSPSTNGYQKLPSGMIIQWGLSEITPTDVYVKFPVAFTRPPLFVGESSPGGGQTTSVWTANAITNVGFNATQICVLSNTSDRVLLSGNNATTWLAIGF
ncbi:hypothetical protein TUM9754_42610 [Escherichia coli]|nr:hypothetical protein TUM9754_42610 [Escherichia coli]